MRPSKTLLAALLVMVAALPVCAKKEKKKEAAPPAAESGSTAGADPVLAYVGDAAVTQSTVDKEAARKLQELRQQEYDVRKAALDKILSDRVYAAEAASRGITMEELLKTEVESKVAPVTDETIKKFYDENQARMGGRTLDQVSNDIRNFLTQQGQQQRRRDFFKEASAKHNVSILLDPPRVNATFRDTDPTRGPKDAPVTIIEYTDYQCPYCKRAHTMMEDIVKQYEGKIRLVFRDYPLQFHAQAGPAAEAAHCAGDQGKYWEYGNNLMTVEGTLQPDDLKKRAGDLGLDVAAFTTCIEGMKHEAKIQESFTEGSALGVTGTPTFFINGRMLVGARPAEEIKAVIDDEIERAARKSGKG